jgi:hypothetical protein
VAADPGVDAWADLSAPLLEQTTHSVSAYPGCLEATIQKRTPTREDARTAGGLRLLDAVEIACRSTRGQAKDPVRARMNAAARTRTDMRRYVLQNQLDHLWTFTLAPEYATHSEDRVREYVSAFRRAIGLDYGPWLTLIEPHPGGHGWHVHAACHGFVPVKVVRAAWALGHVLVSYRGPGDRKGSTSRTSGQLSRHEQSRRLAGYLSKYLGKTLEDTGTEGRGEGDPEGPDPVPVVGFNRKRYSTTRGYSPVVVRQVHSNWSDAWRWIEYLLGGGCRVVWDSSQDDDFEGPPTWLVVLEGT